MAVDVDHAIIAAAQLLGYESLRPRQTEAIKFFCRAEMCLCASRLVAMLLPVAHS